MKMKKFLALTMAAVMSVSLLVGCGGNKDSGKLKIGGAGPLTGGAAIYGNAAKNGATIAAEEINAANPNGLQTCATRTTPTIPRRASTPITP